MTGISYFTFLIILNLTVTKYFQVSIISQHLYTKSMPLTAKMLILVLSYQNPQINKSSN